MHNKSKNVSMARLRWPIMPKTPFQPGLDKTTADNLSLPTRDYYGFFKQSNPTLIETK